MTPLDRHARLGAVGLAALVALAAVRSTAAPGWMFTWKVAGEGQNMTAQVRVLEHRLRMDVQDGSMPGLAAGGYVLLDATKGQMVMVSPREKSAMIMSGEGFASAMDVLGSAGMKMDVTDASTSVESLGEGGEILGYATQRYRVRQSFTVTVSAVGRTESSTIQNEVETWMTTALPAAQQEAFETFERNFMRSMIGMVAMGGEAFKRLADDLQAKRPKGFALKQVQTTTATASGRTSRSSSTIEVTSMAKADLEPSLFDVPGDYRVQDMSALMRQGKRPPE
ncbi:MAG TPA: DUF4412 domain-containing protein [Gemmatimonadaceae bacterium]